MAGVAFAVMRVNVYIVAIACLILFARFQRGHAACFVFFCRWSAAFLL